MLHVEDIIKMKQKNMLPFESAYVWFFRGIEHTLLSKRNGAERVAKQLSEYDKKAQVYIVHQIHNMNPALTDTILTLCGLSISDTFLENEYARELMDWNEDEDEDDWL